MKRILLLLAAAAAAALVAPSCSNDPDDCTKTLEPCLPCTPGDAVDCGSSQPGFVRVCAPDGASWSDCAPADGGGGAGAIGGATTTGGGGTGGCGDNCAECQDDADCTDPTKAKCDGSSCVPCDDSSQCTGVTGTEVCDAGAGLCVQCQLGEEGACSSAQTCDLLAKECVDVEPGAVGNCGACTNDLQCETGHRCIPMEFPLGTSFGHFCLEEAMPTCEQPFSIFINRVSISSAAAVNYCGINEELTTCPAVRALEQNWRCEGDDGKCCSGAQALVGGDCDPEAPEVDVPGALCRQVGALANRCTYACPNDAIQCPDVSPKDTCGGAPAPTWCGG